MGAGVAVSDGYLGEAGKDVHMGQSTGKGQDVLAGGGYLAAYPMK